MLQIHNNYLHHGFANLYKNHRLIKIISASLFVLLITLFGIFLKKVVFADDNPTGVFDVTFSSGSDYVNEDITNKTFNLSTASGVFATIKINAEFNPGQQKKITAKIPTGFKVLSYSATTETADIDGVSKIEIDNAYKGYVTNSNLTAATADTSILDIDGNQVKFAPNTAWQDQTISGYALKTKTSPDSFDSGYTEADQKVYGGDIEWNFVDTTSKVELLFTVSIDTSVLSHIATTEQMPNIILNMHSSKGDITKNCSVTATYVQAFSFGSRPSYPGADTYNVNGESSVPNRSEAFGIGIGASLFNSTALSINLYSGILVDELNVTFTYPEGVYYDDNLDISIIGTTVTTRQYEDDHIKVNVNENSSTGGGIITVALKNLRAGHATLSTSYPRVVAYFRADNTVYSRGNQDIGGSGGVPKPTAEYSYKRNGITKGTTSPIKYNRHLVYPGEKRNITIAPKNLNLHNLDADYENVHFNYLLGSFNLHSALSYSNVHFRYTFKNLGVRDVTLPGSKIRNLSAKVVDQTTGVTREIAIADLPTSTTATLTTGVIIEGDKIGLTENEYISEFNATVNLAQGNNTTNNYIYNSCTYFGHFISNDPDHMPEATLSVIDSDTGEIEESTTGELMTATDRTTYGWTQARTGDLSTTTYNSSGETTTTFYPNQKINITSSLYGTNYVGKNSNEVVNPTIIISLPEGLDLDLSSVQAKAADGTENGELFSLVQKSAPTTQIIDGIKWTTYYYKSENPLALVAKRQNSPRNITKGSSPMYVYFQVIVGIDSPQYNLSLKDILSYDLGQTAASGSSKNSVYPDKANRAGKNTDDNTYNLAAAGATIQIKPLIGLNIDIGIRTKGFNQDFMTYNGTEGSIAVVSKNNTAEVKVHYDSTSSSEFKAGTVIYMPVPKKGIDYDKYFENIELVNPLIETHNATFSYSTKLASIPSLVGNDGTTWTTYLATNVTGSNSHDYVAGDGSWEPVESSSGTINWTKASDYTGDLSDVIMMKFVANNKIVPGASGECTYDLVLDPSTTMSGDGNDYWRTYNKAITENDNTGIWNYSSVIAVNAHGIGLEGQIFIDADDNAKYSEQDNPYTDNSISVVLFRDDNTEPVRNLIVDENGHFTNKAEDTGDGIPLDFVLKEGDYTLTITKNDPESKYIFSRHEASETSNPDEYYNDIKIPDISEDGQTVTYKMTINPTSLSNNGYMVYTGIALRLVEPEPEPTPEPEPEPTPVVPVPNTGIATPEQQSSIASGIFFVISITSITCSIIFIRKVISKKQH